MRETAETLFETQTPPSHSWRARISPIWVTSSFGIAAIVAAITCLVLGSDIWEAVFAGAMFLTIGVVLGRATAEKTPIHRTDVFPRFVQIEGECLSVTSPSSRIEYSLADCCWFLGKESDDALLDVGQQESQVPVVVLPTGSCIACGINAAKSDVPGAVSRWSTTLDRSCPRVLRREGVRGLCVSLLHLFALIAGFFSGGWIGGLLSEIILVGQLGKELAVFSACMATGYFSFLGAWILTPGWHRPIPSDRWSLYRPAVLLPPLLAFSRQKFVELPLDYALCFAVGWALFFLIVTRIAVRHLEHVMRRSRRTTLHRRD